MDFLAEIEKLLDMTAADKAEVMRELTAHFEELYDGFVGSGMCASKAQAEAEKHMGTPADIAARLNAAHNSASWRSALLCMVPFAASAIYLSASVLGLDSGGRLALLVTVGVAMLSVSAREFLRRRRPLWLATWFAAGLLCVPSTLYLIGGSERGLEAHRANAAAVLLLAALTATTAFLVRRYVVGTLATGAVASLCAVYVLLGPADLNALKFLPLLTMVVCMVVLIALLARLIFAAHTYGSAIQATLFLLGVFVLRLADPTHALGNWAPVTGVALCGVMVLWFLRTPRRGTKAMACYLALFVYALASQWYVFQPDPRWQFSALYAALSAAMSAGLYQLVVASPMYPLMRNEVERNRLTPVR